MHMQDDMAEATRLTRGGRLAEATALIQRALGRRGGPTQAPPPPSAPRTDRAGGHLVGGRLGDGTGQRTRRSAQQRVEAVARRVDPARHAVDHLAVAGRRRHRRGCCGRHRVGQAAR
ncbi:MAG: hypothetical protein ACJ75K_02700, partial [Actinomycetes bacterium]